MIYMKDTSKIARIAAELRLPYLSGTDKQRAWANVIRANILSAMRYLMENTELVSPEEFELAKKQDTSRYWIDRRDDALLLIDSANAHYFMHVFDVERNIYRPDNPTKEGTVDIIHDDGIVYFRRKKFDRDYARIVDNLVYIGYDVRFGYPHQLMPIVERLLMSGFTINIDQEISIKKEMIPEDLLDDDD